MIVFPNNRNLKLYFYRTNFIKLRMKNFTTGILMFLFISISAFAQDNNSIYATMDINNAEAFKVLYPDEIQILESNDKISAVKLTHSLSTRVRDNVQTHGSGYIFKDSQESALSALNAPARRPNSLEYTITENDFVIECLDLVNPLNIELDILDLQAYGTRYHTTTQAQDVVYDQKAKWDAMIAASGRTDVHTRIFEHVNTPMPSVILTFDGANNPSEFVIIGGHIDSTSYIQGDAPGADDNASGISSLNEMVRVLLAKGFIPNRTIEVMAFAAEEIGLVGSGEIAANYNANGINVVGYVQFDMTGYEGSNKDIYILTDWYTSDSLNNYLADLMEHYNSSGPHFFNYGYSECGYGCSDHASWADKGYDASMPFEAKMGEDNPKIHSPFDTYSFLDTPDHAAKFTKLGLEFLIEAAKPQTLAVDDFSEASMYIFVNDKMLNYRMNNSQSRVKELSIFNIAGQVVMSETKDVDSGHVSLERFSEGFYIAKFTLENGHTLSKKFILK